MVWIACSTIRTDSPSFASRGIAVCGSPKSLSVGGTNADKSAFTFIGGSLDILRFVATFIGAGTQDSIRLYENPITQHASRHLSVRTDNARQPHGDWSFGSCEEGGGKARRGVPKRDIGGALREDSG